MSWNEAPTAPRWIANPDGLLSQCARLTDWIDGTTSTREISLTYVSVHMKSDRCREYAENFQ